MRKDSIVRDFKNIPVGGVINMQETTNFLMSKIMDIEDTIRVSSSATTDIYDPIKFASILSITPDPKQNSTDANQLTQWLIEFDGKNLLREYLYNEIYTDNPFSVFKQLDSSLINGNKNNLACYDYIDKNLIDRYNLTDFIFWTQFYSLKNLTIPGSGSSPEDPLVNILYKTPVYNYRARDTDAKKQTVNIKEYADGTSEIAYKQNVTGTNQTIASSQYSTFIYYFDVIYTRI